MAYFAPNYNAVNFQFGGTYTAPSGSAVAISFQLDAWSASGAATVSFVSELYAFRSGAYTAAGAATTGFAWTSTAASAATSSASAATSFKWTSVANAAYTSTASSLFKPETSERTITISATGALNYTARAIWRVVTTIAGVGSYYAPFEAGISRALSIAGTSAVNASWTATAATKVLSYAAADALFKAVFNKNMRGVLAGYSVVSPKWTSTNKVVATVYGGASVTAYAFAHNDGSSTSASQATGNFGAGAIHVRTAVLAATSTLAAQSVQLNVTNLAAASIASGTFASSFSTIAMPDVIEVDEVVHVYYKEPSCVVSG